MAQTAWQGLGEIGQPLDKLEFVPEDKSWLECEYFFVSIMAALITDCSASQGHYHHLHLRTWCESLESGWQDRCAFRGWFDRTLLHQGTASHRLGCREELTVRQLTRTDIGTQMAQ